MAKVRGTAILGTLEFARARFGEEQTRELVESLSQAQRGVLLDAAGAGIAAHGWYETSLLADLTNSLDARCGRGDLSLAREAGTHVAFQDVNRFFKWLLRLGGPSILFNRAGAVWNNYYDDGRYVLESLGEGRAVIRIEGSSSAGPVVCKRIEGWMERALVLTLGAHAAPVIREEGHLVRNPAVSEQAYCRFVAEWKA
jgi:hypothetical protein